MIQNTNDIYNLIKQPEYVMPFLRKDMKPYGKYSVHNNAGDRVDIILGVRHVEISVFHNMNSVYYETMSKSNTAGRTEYKRFRELLTQKHIAALSHYINENHR